MLYVIGTPIGNLKDITFRAVEVLNTLDILFCEDIRTTKKLLSHYKINPVKLLNIRDMSEIRRYVSNNELKIGVVVESGSVNISDPGLGILDYAMREGIDVKCIPGVSSLTAALSVCPVKFDDFVFLGFLPKKRSKLEKLLGKYSDSNIVAFESPFRIRKTLEAIVELFPEKTIFIARELTKVFESLYLGNAAELINKVIYKGEMTLLIGK